MYRW
ncbi:hypothetical protein D043_5071A, partial [Vibrio parahaemolyticus EKP-021]